MISSSILFGVLVLGCSANILNPGEIKFSFKKHGDDIFRFEITDGDVIMKGKTSTSNGMLSCKVIDQWKKVDRMLRDSTIKSKTLGVQQLLSLRDRCTSLTTTKRKQRRDSSGNDSSKPKPTIESFNQQIVKGKPFPGDLGTGKPSGAGSHFAIFPGTKWCGYENVAKDMSDLGTAIKTDSCCRTHDHCPYYIDRFETKFHYLNEKPWTVSHCECDQHLFKCLKSVNTTTSDEVGKLFFGLLDVNCFTFQTGQYCAQHHWSHLWCEKEVTGPMAFMQEFPHKWSDNVTSTNDSNNIPVVG